MKSRRVGFNTHNEMQRRSAKTQKVYNQWMFHRLDYLSRHTCCLGGGAADDVHEILAGAHRMKAFVEPCTWLPVSRLQHDELQGMPIVDQLALKLLVDPENFSLERFHTVWGRPPTAITAAEVIEALRQHLMRQAA